MRHAVVIENISARKRAREGEVKRNRLKKGVEDGDMHLFMTVDFSQCISGIYSCQLPLLFGLKLLMKMMFWIQFRLFVFQRVFF
jgi:hypothetical protein